VESSSERLGAIAFHEISAMSRDNLKEVFDIIRKVALRFSDTVR